MKTQEILSIVALGLLGVCLLCGLAKMTMKGDKAKQTCNQICSLSLFVALVLLGTSQLLKEMTKSPSPSPSPSGPTPGALGENCKQGGKCNGVLTCVNKKCVPPLPNPQRDCETICKTVESGAESPKDYDKDMIGRWNDQKAVRDLCTSNCNVANVTCGLFKAPPGSQEGEGEVLVCHFPTETTGAPGGLHQYFCQTKTCGVLPP